MKTEFDSSAPREIKMPDPRDIELCLPQSGSVEGSVNPQSVKRGTVVRLKGVGFKPQEKVRFHIRDGHGKDILTVPVEADRDGATGDVCVPTETFGAGEYRVVVVSQSKKARKAEIWLRVLAEALGVDASSDEIEVP